MIEKFKLYLKEKGFVNPEHQIQVCEKFLETIPDYKEPVEVHDYLLGFDAIEMKEVYYILNDFFNHGLDLDFPLDRIPFRARCSSLGNLMGNPKATNKKIYLYDGFEISAQKFYKYLENGESNHLTIKTIEVKKELLTETAKSEVLKYYDENNVGFKIPVDTLGMRKGHLTEPMSRDLIRNVYGGPYRKQNTKNFFNEFLTGTPDHVLKDMIEDIKANETFDTYRKVDTDSKLNPLYDYQMKGYMWLTDKKKGRVIYVLHPDPDEIHRHREAKFFYMYGADHDNPDYIEKVDQLNKNQEIIKSLPEELRTKYFDVEITEDLILKMKEKIINARNYYNKITLDTNAAQLKHSK